MSEANGLTKLTPSDAVENGKIVRSTIFRCIIGSTVSEANGLTKLTHKVHIKKGKIRAQLEFSSELARDRRERCTRVAGAKR